VWMSSAGGELWSPYDRSAPRAMAWEISRGGFGGHERSVVWFNLMQWCSCAWSLLYVPKSASCPRHTLVLYPMKGDELPWHFWLVKPNFANNRLPVGLYGLSSCSSPSAGRNRGVPWWVFLHLSEGLLMVRTKAKTFKIVRFVYWEPNIFRCRENRARTSHQTPRVLCYPKQENKILLSRWEENLRQG